jgi:hypothetical protein
MKSRPITILLAFTLLLSLSVVSLPGRAQVDGARISPIPGAKITLGQTYYVDPTGSDLTGDGSAGAP